MFHPVSKGIIAILIGLVAPLGAASAASAATAFTPAPVSAAPQPTTQGIIMSDGRICNPRWGC